MYRLPRYVVPHLWLLIGPVFLLNISTTLAAISFSDLQVADNITLHSIKVDLNPFNTYETFAITFFNSGDTPLTGHFYLAIENISPSTVTVDWPTEASTEGFPYHQIIDPVLAPGELHIRFAIFKKPTRNTTFTFTPKIYFAATNPPNTSPVANAGEDATVSVGDTATLDGTNSTDADGDSLTYQWSFQSKPDGSSAILSEIDDQSPTFTIDLPGSYIIALIVNDGQLDSELDTVKISTPVDNDNPTIEVALSRQPNTAGWLNQDVTVTFICNDQTSGISFCSDPLTVSSEGANQVITGTASDGAGNTAITSVSLNIDKTPPTILATPDPLPNAAGWNNSDVELNYICFDSLSGIDTCPSADAIIVEASNQSIYSGSLDIAGNRSTVNTIISIDKTSPEVNIDAPLNNSEVTVPEVVVAGHVSDINSITTITINGESMSLDTDGNFNQTIKLAKGVNELDVVATDIADNTGQALVDVTVIESNGETELPPDPVEIAPPIDPTVATTLAAATSFLYTGTNPIQTGVADGVINPERVAVLRGTVYNRDNEPLSGVSVSVHNHPEFGQTASRLDGMFDLVVNGGGYLTFEYNRDGYLPVQRTINVPWQDYSWLPDIVMVSVDPQVTTIDLNAAVPVQVARGSVTTDTNGIRQATLLFTDGTNSTMTLPDGTTQPLTTLNVRATEYTIGDNGPESMPAELPPLTGYTYAVDFTVDEAISAHATAVQFNKPVYSYLENFLGFSVGSAVPTGYYDRINSNWVPSDNGRVIQILSIENGLAEIDVDGSSQKADTTALAALGVSTAELEQLASLYTSGQSLWRVPITHFTPWDYNWTYVAPDDAEVPTVASPVVNDFDKHDDPNCRDGSIIECENQILRESKDIVGTPFSINYSSNRVPGRNASTVIIPLSNDTVPSSLKRIDVEITIAGNLYEYSYPPLPDQKMTFSWDGKDAYGRDVQGAQRAIVGLFYVYDAIYLSRTDYLRKIFGLPPSSLGTPDGTAGEIRLSKKARVKLASGSGYSHAQGLGGWSLSVLHEYVPNERTLYLGTGERRTAISTNLDLSTIISTIAGDGISGYSGDGGSSYAAHLAEPRDVAIAADGSLYIADSANNRIRRVSPDGTITTVAGNGDAGFSGDGGPAVQAALDFPTAVSVGPNGELLISDSNNLQIRRVATDGIISTVIGLGIPLNDIITSSGCATPDPRRPGSIIVAASEGCLSTDFVFAHSPGATAFGSDGSIYFAIPDEHLIYHLGNDGIAYIYAGTGISGYNGDGIPSREAFISFPSDMLMTSDGNLIFTDSDNNRVRQIGSDGIIRTIAGTGDADYTGDGGSAISASFNFPTGIASGSDGALYILDSDNNRVRKISTDGVINTVIGNGANGEYIEGGLAKNTFIGDSVGIAIGPDERIFIPQPTVNCLYNVVVSMPSFSGNNLVIPSKEGDRLYQFDQYGRHMSTTNAYTGETQYQFEYEDNYLTSIMDGDGNTTQIERDPGTHAPSAIIGPDGQSTLLSVSPGGYLSRITNPAGEHYDFSYSQSGLLETMTDPRANSSHMQYDVFGRMIQDDNAAGGGWTLERTNIPSGSQIGMTSALGHITLYTTEKVFSPTHSVTGQRRLIINPDATQTETISLNDGSTFIMNPDGTTAFTQIGPDPRLGMQAPIINDAIIAAPSGLTRVEERERTVLPASDLVLEDSVKINGRSFTSIYDYKNLSITNTTPLGRQTIFNVDSQFRVHSTTVAGFNSESFSYDTRGRLSSMTDGTGADARTTTLSYDFNGFVDRITDPLGRNISFEYDAAGRVTHRTLPDGRFVDYSYDANGNVTSITPPGRSAHVFNYTPVNMEKDYTPPIVTTGADVTQYTYNLDKQLTQISRPDGRAIDIGYDTFGRLANTIFSRGTTSYTYDSSGRIIQVNDPGGEVLNFAYDGMLPTTESWSGMISGSVSLNYDNNFWVSGVSVNDSSITYSHDNDGLLTQAGNLILNHDARNGLLVGTSLGSVATSISYNGFGENQGINATYGGTSLYSTSYSRDKLGRITTLTETIEGTTSTFDYSFDLAGRLIEVKKGGITTATYSYDNNSNRIGGISSGGPISAIYDSQDKLLTYNDTVYSYNANGNLLAKTAQTATTIYNYDEFGNLTSVSLPGDITIDYIVDGNNRRVGKLVNGTLTQGFLYQDQINPVAEVDGNGHVVTRFIYASKLNVPEYMIKGGITYRIISDHLGSPRLVININDGTISQRMDYDEFGNVINDTNPGFQPFGYAGGIYDPHTGLTRFGARDYDSQTGRWTTKDPILFQGGDTNLYGYVLNDPINWVDLLGLSWFRPMDHPYKVGRPGTIVPEGNGEIGGYLDDYGPAWHTTGYYHDMLVEIATRHGIPDVLINIPTIPIVYIFSIGVEIGNSIQKLFGRKGLQHNPMTMKTCL